jgi:hypothetical protein
MVFGTVTEINPEVRPFQNSSEIAWLPNNATLTSNVIQHPRWKVDHE